MRVISTEEVEQVSGGFWDWIFVVVILWLVDHYNVESQGCLSSDPNYCNPTPSGNADGTD